jgi:uncharacterized protein (DUF4415 family)
MSRTELTSAERDDLTKLAALSGEEIDLQDIPEASAGNWRYALSGMIHIDHDVLKWFRKHVGREYTSEINRVLRLYISPRWHRRVLLNNAVSGHD